MTRKSNLSTIFLITAIFFLISVISIYAEEQITITTYYPSPYGSYNELDTRYLEVKTPARSTWGGWQEAIRFSSPSHSAMTFPSGYLLYGLHSDRNFYWADTAGYGYAMSLYAPYGNLWVKGQVYPDSLYTRSSATVIGPLTTYGYFYVYNSGYISQNLLVGGTVTGTNANITGTLQAGELRASGGITLGGVRRTTWPGTNWGSCSWRSVPWGAYNWQCNNGEYMAGIGYEGAEWQVVADNHSYPEVNQILCCRMN